MYTTPMPGPPEKPAPLKAGVFAAAIACVAALAEGYFWLDVYFGLVDLIPDNAKDSDMDQSLEVYQSFLIIVVIASTIIAATTMFGAIMAMNNRNGGRITIWIAGGIATAWHMCCSGYTLLIRAVFTKAVTDANADPNTPINIRPDDYFPVWKVDAAILTGFASGVAAVLAIILVAQRSVNVYFRALKPPPMGYAGYSTPPGW